MAKTPYYTKAESDSKNWEVFREVKQTTEAISAGEGGKLYDTLALAQAVEPKPANGTVFQVRDLGYYSFQSSETGGTRFEREFLKTKDIVNPDFHQIKITTPDTYNIGESVFIDLPAGYNVLSLGITVDLAERSMVELIKVDDATWEIKNKTSDFENGLSHLNNQIGADAVKTITGAYKLKNNVLKGLTQLSVYAKFTFHQKGDRQSFLDYDAVLDTSGFTFQTLADDVRLAVGNGSTSTNTFYENLIDGKEYEILYTLDATSAKLYVNNSLAQEKPSTAFDISSIRGLFIGGYYYDDPTQLNASDLKNFKILNRVCTPEEVSPDFIEDPALLLQLNKDSISDKLWIDTSSNNNGASLAVEEKKPTLVFNPANDNFVPVHKKNLFSKENIIHNQIISSKYGFFGPFNSDGTGLEISGVGFFDTNPDKWYYIRNGFKGGYVVAGGYASNGGDLGLVPISGKRSIAVKAARQEGLTPVDVVRIYFNIYRLHKETDLPSFDDVAVYELDGEFDTNIPEEIVAFGQEKELNQNLIATEPIYSPYKNLNVLVFGDSITANRQWTMYLKEKLKIENLFNVAIGGANIVQDENIDGSGGAGDPYNRRHLKPQIKYTPSNLSKQIFEFGEIINGEHILKLNVVIISMGFNDAKNNWPLGDWETVQASNWTTLSEVNTLYGSLKYNLNTLMNTVIKDTVTIGGVDYVVGIDCTEAKIIWQTPIQTAVSDSTELRLPEYCEAIRTACEYYGIPVIDGYHKSGISREVELLYPAGKYLLDKIHPNKLGYRKLGALNTSGLISNFI